MSFLAELKRRNVLRVSIAYVVLAWLMAQVAELLLDAFGAPDWALKSILGLFLLGFPFVVFFSWAFELTPEGLRREHEVDREDSITAQTGRKLDWAIIVLLVVALAWLAWDRFTPSQTGEQDLSGPTATTAPDDPGSGAGDALPVVAVLPFKATGSDDGGFLAAGLHDDLLTRLAKLGAYRVISRTSVTEYADSTKNIRQIGEELGATYILEGGVQAMPGRVRINAQLILAAADDHLWAEVYDQELTAESLFDVQAEMAKSIANALHTELSPTDQALVDQVPTRNMAAYKAFLRGLQLSKSSGYVGTRDDRNAVAAFEEAVRLDPEFAEAWAQLSVARTRAAAASDFDSESAEEALAALARARALKPGLLESELAWAEYLYRFQNEYEQALEILEALGSRASGNVDALQLMAWLNRRLGRFDEAYTRLLEARELAPRDPSTYLALVQYAWLVEDCEAAGRHAATLLSLATDMSAARVRVAEYEMQCNGDTARATEIFKSVDIEDIGFWLYAYLAALHERDWAWAMTLVEWDRRYPLPFDEVFDELFTAQVNRYLLHDDESMKLALDRAEILLEELESNPQLEKRDFFAFAKAFLHSLRGDASSAEIWVRKAIQRQEEQLKGDIAQMTNLRLALAVVLTQAGLYDEAVEELRIMLEEPGGHRFPIIDGHPVYEALEDHPGFVALRERFGNPQPD